MVSNVTAWVWFSGIPNIVTKRSAYIMFSQIVI